MTFKKVFINPLLIIDIPENWSHENDGKFRALNEDNTIKLTISCYEKDVSNAEAEFAGICQNYFMTFDKHYKPLTQVIKNGTNLLKVYQAETALEYHALTYVTPLTNQFTLVCFVFHSIRDIEESDTNTFNFVINSLAYKVTDLPKS